MLFQRITEPHPYLPSIQVWYESSFPADERRQFDELLQLLPCPDMHLCALTDEERLVGFLIYWQWPGVVFLEHFAIDPNLRGNQLGQRALAHLQELDSPRYLLEVELPTDELSRRRIQFYERQGFSVNPFPYAQPPYQRGNPPIPMHLMSSPFMLSREDFDSHSQSINERVYKRFYSKD
ncbi:GNAT family N-acetyltransferase [Spirosoma fluviale]|uniref:Acetyltransferase (GNAT) family protein n=1 Tax=Spirosoma fluviale TaxID=1597977 RepID=A0A286FGU6_9BACT|nr:GNAT family N-acetyltransferase [Spirosoma fluviale]SOD82024.1 Acetyltransferase (GNAT) family protein [Spirosoma fluviale]